MKLADIMRESLILPEITTREKSEALRKMTEMLSLEFPELDQQELFSVIMERERLSSTGIGSGIAIPHARLSQAKQHIASFGRSRLGILFDAIDAKPVHLIFLIVGPQNANEVHLQALARISKFLHDTSFRDKLFTAETASLIYEAIIKKDSQY